MALRLAIIEDNADLLDELLAWLGYRGFEVWGTRSAEAFWRQLHSHPVDIVLVDIGLPGEDGFSVLNYLHELGHYGLVVVSARGQQQDKLQALSLGADAYLIKPVNFAHLAETLTALGARLAPGPSGGSAWRRRSARRRPSPPAAGVCKRIN